VATRGGAEVARQAWAGRIAIGAPADLIVVPPHGATAAEALLEAHRRDLRLVTIGGRPLVGDRGIADRVFAARAVATRPLCIDGIRKLADATLVRRIASCPIAEPGVTA